MHSMFPRSVRALLAAAALAVSAAAAGPAIAAPPPRDEALEESAASRTTPIPSFEDPNVAFHIQLLGCPTPDQLAALQRDLSLNPGEQDARDRINASRKASNQPPLDPSVVLLPLRDARVSCDAGRLRIGIFPGRVPTSPEVSRSRDQGMARVNLIDSGVSAVRVHPRVNKLMERLTGLRLSDMQKEKPSLRFEGFGPKAPRVQFVAPNKIVTTIRGKDTRPFPDLSFTTTITDTLSVQDRKVRCTSKAVTKANTRVHKALFALSLLTVPANGGTLSAAFAAQLALIADGVADQNRAPAEQGPGCAMAEEVFIPEVELPGGGKAALDYHKVGIENGAPVARFGVRAQIG